MIPGRFRVLNVSDARKIGVSIESQSEDFCLLLDFSTTPPTYIGDDSSEPEDATLQRSFAWVAEAMNALAES